MAEETINTAESLNNQLSPVDQLMAQSSFLDPAKIEQSMAPILNWPDNFVNPTNYIKDNTAGVSPNYPPSEVKQSRITGDSINSVDAILKKGIAKINGLSDMGSYAEPYAYDASPKGTFRAKYKAYGQETFNKVGFHPLIDNETWFNQNTTFGDDLSRWASNSAWPMISKGFMDPIKSYKSIIDGEGLFNADEQSARDYEYYNAIGASSKGGLGGFTVNLFNSASYSMGILLEAATEGALIGALFGGGVKGAVEGGSKFMQKLGSLPKALVQSGQATKTLLQDVKNYSNISKAKELYTAAGKNFGNFFNPLTNTTEAFRQIKNTDNISNLARSATTAGALWHDMMAMNMALSEGKLEGGFTRYETYDRLYNKHFEEKGVPPTLEEQESMMRQSSKGAWWNTLNNTALIYYSNKLVFPSITNASFLKGVPKFGFGKTVTNVGKEFQILFDPGKKALEGNFVKQRVNFVNAIKSLAKPSTYGKVGLNYFKANVVEGGQEILQDVLQEATQNYYVNTFKNHDARNFRYGTGLIGDAISKQWSSQGLETFLSGFLMGSILQAPGKIKSYATVGFNDYFKKDAKYQEYITGREKLADDVVNELNTMYKQGQFFLDPRINNYANQGLVANVVDNPDDHTTKEIRDAEFTAFQSAVMSSLQTGTYDMFLNHYEGYKQASPEDIEQAWNLAPGQGIKALERFDKALENAKDIGKRWSTAKTKMNFQANLDDYEKDSEEYRIAEVYNKAYSQSLYNYVFLHNSFDDNLKRLDKLYNELGQISAIKNSPFSNFVDLTDSARLTQEIEMLKTEVENLQSFGNTPALEEATKKRELIELYSDFNEKQEGLIDLFINKSFLDNIKAKILKEDPTLTDNQVTIKSINKIVEQYDTAKSSEFLEYKESFEKLLFGLADTATKRTELEQQLFKMGGIDTIFDSLLDTFILKNENASLIKYVNTLSNPREFYEHLMRNFKYMKDLYNNREEIAKDIVNKEIEAIENNTLLNTLADEGYYIDLNEFSNWVENKALPEQFIDAKNNRIINKGSVLYEDLIKIFLRAAILAEKKPAGDPLNQKQLLDKRIQNLENDRDDLLKKEKDKYDENFKKVNGLTPDEYEAQEKARIASEELTADQKLELEKEKKELIKAVEKLESKNYIEVQAAGERVSELIEEQGINAEEYFDEQYEIFLNDAVKKKLIQDTAKIYDVSDIDDVEEKTRVPFEAALNSKIFGQYASARLIQIEEELNKKPATPTIDIENTKEYKLYQEAIQEINNKFDALIVEVKEEFKEKGIDETTPNEYTNKTEFQDFDSEYQSEITNLFDEYLVNVLMEDISLKTSNPLDYEKFRKNWLERQNDLIDKFNQDSKQKAQAKALKLAEIPVLKFAPAKIDGNTPTFTISSIINALNRILQVGEYTDSTNKNKKISLTPQNIADIKDDIAALNGYLNARVSMAAPRNIAEETIELIQEYIINKQEEIIEVYDEDGNMIGRTFKDRESGEPLPERTTQVAEEIETTLLDKEPFQYDPLKDTVNEDGEVVVSAIENLFNQFFNDPEIEIKDKIRLFMDAFKRKAYQSGKGGYKQFRYQEKLDAVQNSLETIGTLAHLKKTIDRYAFKESSDAGDYVDTLIRIFLTPNASTNSKFSEFNYDSKVEIKGRMMNISDMMSRKVFDKLFSPVTATNPGGIVTKFRLGIIDGTYTILSENVKLFDRSLRNGRGVTGEIDLLLVREDGSVAIVDIKTSSDYKWNEFGKGGDYDKSTYFRAQQSIYGTMFYNNTAITPDLKLMPFAVVLSEDRVGYIEDIDLASIVPEGQDTIELEYLEEISDFGIIKTMPDIKAPIKKQAGTEVVNETIEGLPESNPKMNKLKDNLNKAVIFNGRSGKLVRMPDGSFGVEVTINNDITSLQLTLDALQANLLVEKGEFGNQELIDELENDIKKISSAITSAKGITEVFPLQTDSKNISDENITLDKAGLQLVIPIESVGQLSTINGEVINASFSNKEDSIASINGVRYDVLRDASGNITALSYMSNSEQISSIDKQVNEINNKINNLRSIKDTNEDGSINLDYKQDSIITSIGKLQNQIQTLIGKRTGLVETNKKIYVYGENSNNFIFALNRLPNNFQRLTIASTKANEIQDLDSISKMSLNSSIADSITQILSEQYPEAMDKLIDGDTKSLDSKDLLNIQLWIEDTVEKLNQLGYSVINRGDLVDDITNQISVLNEINNNLALIKLTKDGKIRNYKQVAEIFSESGVQERPSISKNESTIRGKTERVSRPSSREELKELVKKSREENLESLFGQEIVNKTDDKAVDNIMNATLNNIEEIFETEFLKAQKENLNAAPIRKAYSERIKQLTKVVSIANVSNGEYLLLSNNLISEEIHLVVAKTKDSVTLKNINTEEKATYTEQELVENFQKTTMEATQPESEVEITQFDVEESVQSKDTIKEIQNDEPALTKAKTQAKSSDRKSRLKKLGDNSKLC